MRYLQRGLSAVSGRRAAPRMPPKDIEMARVPQRCIMEALDHSRAAATTLTTGTGKDPTVEVRRQH